MGEWKYDLATDVWEWRVAGGAITTRVAGGLVRECVEEGEIRVMVYLFHVLRGNVPPPVREMDNELCSMLGV